MVLHDFLHSWGQILRNPGLAITATLILALRIGGNYAIFSMVSTVLVRPLP